MNGHILKKDFFMQRAPDTARNLLGKYLAVCGRNGTARARMITETEAYGGFTDKASHASGGKTMRNAPMFEEGGIWYVYLIYGMYDMVNIVTGDKGYPAAVLIRGVEGVIGPGKLTKHLGITRAYNGLPAARRTGLWIEDRDISIPKRRIQKSARIGVSYAGPVWAEKKYRFFIAP